jgi:hypothetical protein
MQNKAKVKMGNINISIVKTKAYAEEQRTMNNERCSKQTQSNPISQYPARWTLYAPRYTKQTQFPRPPPAPGKNQKLGAKRISRFIGPASKIEYPASRIKHLPHFAVHSWLHYAKQSQSQNGQYKHKYGKNKGLCQKNNEQ